jgi:hypothetical protein
MGSEIRLFKAPRERRKSGVFSAKNRCRKRRIAKMDARMFVAATVFAAAPLSNALAESWQFGVGVGFGAPIYAPPPPVYYDAPVVYEPAPPPVVYDPAPPPVVYAPAPPTAYPQPAPVDVAPDGRPVFHIVAPNDVLDGLEAAGYRELSPMNMRGQSYVLAAVDPLGDLVQLELSIFTGEILQTALLREGYRPSLAAAPRPVASAIAPAPQAAPQIGGNEAPVAGRDPLVVY